MIQNVYEKVRKEKKIHFLLFKNNKKIHCIVGDHQSFMMDNKKTYLNTDTIGITYKTVSKWCAGIKDKKQIVNGGQYK